MLETRGWISLILGFITTAFGLIPLLHSFGWIGFNLPFTVAGTILCILLVVGGIFLLFDSAHEMHLKWISIILGLVLVALGGLTLLFKFGVIGFDLSGILAVDIIKNIILIAGGIFLIFGAGD